MSVSGSVAASSVMPLMRYRDVSVASDWLCTAFGFEPHFVATAPDGSVFYAELQLGQGMILLGSVGEPNLDAVMGQPGDPGTVESQSCYVVVADTRAHFERAKRAGAEIVLDHKTDDKGGRGYSCRDLEGHVWNFGTYDPWTAQDNKPAARGRSSRLFATLMCATLAGSAVTGWWVYAPVRESFARLNLRETLLGERAEPPRGGWSTGTIPRDDGTSAATRAELARAHAAMAALKADLERERAAREVAAQTAATAKAAAAEAKSAQIERDREAEAARLAEDALASERRAKEAAVAAAATAQEDLARERAAREAAVKAAGDAEGKAAATAAANQDLKKEADAERQRAAAIASENPPPELDPKPEPEAEPTVSRSTKPAKPADSRSKPAKRPAPPRKNTNAAPKKQQQEWPFSSW